MIKFSDKENEVMCNMIGACESGGQIYGNRDYGCFCEAFANSSIETAITIGWAQNYGTEAKKLMVMIQKADPSGFAKLDTAGIAADLNASDWSNYRISKNSAKAKCIISIITSPTGKKCQDQLFAELCQTYINHGESLGVTDHTGLAECINMSHQGGTGATKRVLAKTTKPYNADNIYKAMQSDTGNQVGAYKSRQKLIYDWIKKYWPTDNGASTASGSATESTNVSKPSTSNTTSGGNNMGYDTSVNNTKYNSGTISNSGKDENNGARGGRAGDQTGNEWEIRSYYAKNWNYVLRHPNAEVRELIATLAEEAAANNKIGYNQNARTTFWTQLTKCGYRPKNITVACDADCSAGVAACCKAVGYLIGDKKLQSISPDNWTGSMVESFRAAGFQTLTESKYLTSPDYLLRGDILLNTVQHTCTNLANGSKSGATASGVPSSASAVADGGNGSLNTKTKSYLYAKENGTPIRKWAGNEYDTLVSVPTVKKNTKLGLCDAVNDKSGHEWYFVKVNDVFGFVDSSKVSNKKVATDKNDNVEDINKEKTEAQIKEQTVGAYNSDVAGRSGEVVDILGSKVALSNTDTFNTKRPIINARIKVGTYLNFRVWPSVYADNLRSKPTLDNGDRVVIYDACRADDDDNDNIWLYIKYNDVFGFVDARYISK